MSNHLHHHESHVNTIITLWAIIGLLVIVIMTMVFYFRSSDNPVTSERRTVVRDTVAATIYPIYDIARNISAGVAEVELVLPVNAEPHTYEPTPSAMIAISSAKAVYAVGHNLDGWIQSLADAGNVPTVIVDQDIQLRIGGHHHEADEDEHHEGEESEEYGYDPHYWLSAANAKIIATNIARDLAVRFPDKTSVIAANLAVYGAQLDNADAEVRRLLASVDDRRIASFHGAFGYFAAAYGLKIAAVFEPYPGQEPTPRYLADLSTKVKELNIKTIYHEPAFNAATIRSFANENGLALGELDALGGVSNRASLIDLLVFDANSVATNQK